MEARLSVSNGTTPTNVNTTKFTIDSPPAVLTPSSPDNMTIPHFQTYHPQVHELKLATNSPTLLDEDEDFKPPKERWAPLGAVSSPEPSNNGFNEGSGILGSSYNYMGGSMNNPNLSGYMSGGFRSMAEGSSSMTTHYGQPATFNKLVPNGAMSEHPQQQLPLQSLEQLKRLEQEQEQLNNSLLALTSHFAQVQFRLKQIIETDAKDKDTLLRELEEFTFRGVPDLSQIDTIFGGTSLTTNDSKTTKGQSQGVGPATEERVIKQRKRQLQLIEQLKMQLQDLETYAYETGELDHPPTMQQLEKQRLVIDELRDKLALNLVDYHNLSTDELKKALEEAVDQIVNPVKNKEKLLEQLKTQVSDLERFIEFLQGDLNAMDNISPANADRFASLVPPDLKKEECNSLHCNCRCPVHDKRVSNKTDESNGGKTCVCKSRGCTANKNVSERKNKSGNNSLNDRQDHNESLQSKGVSRGPAEQEFVTQRKHTIGLMKRAVTLMQLFAASQLGCSLLDEQGRPIVPTSGPTPPSERPPEQRRHWGDLRAKLEIAIERVVEKVQQINAEVNNRRGGSAGSGALTRKRGDPRMSSASSVRGESAVHAGDESVFSERTTRLLPGDVSEEDTEDGDVMEEYHSDTEEYMIAESQKEVTMLVRKELCPALAALIQHGLISDQSVSRSILPFGCFSGRQRAIPEGEENSVKIYHAWDLFIKFYELKHGREYNESAATKLSQSFDLDIVGGKAITMKQQLLSAIGTVIQMHSRFKRSDDAKFKSLICMALNEKKLVPWLRLIVKNPIFLDFYYRQWSYTVKTGFSDGLHSLNRLSALNFNLPYDLAVRQFRNIKDAF